MLEKFVQLYRYYIFPRKTMVIILSTMRSGSTLLKALMAEADDVSNLPETGYEDYLGGKYMFYEYASRLSSEKIVVLKKPQWFSVPMYPFSFPKNCSRVKFILLVRNPADNVASLMSVPGFDSRGMTDSDLIEYWIKTYRRYLNFFKGNNYDFLCVRYEELTRHPISVTKRIFSYIGSQCSEGVDSYKKPDSYSWAWGSDDGGDVVLGLRVIKNVLASEMSYLNDLVDGYGEVKDIQRDLSFFGIKTFE